MNKSKHIILITLLFLLMMGAVSTVSATERNMTPEQFLNNISAGINQGDIITITNGTVNVTENYKISTSDIIVKANGTVIFQGNKNNCRFTIAGTNVTLQGITFQNFNNTEGAGAIYWQGANGNVENCIFKHNTGYNGAIYFDSSNANISDSTFYENIGSYGGAIYGTKSNGDIVDCNFQGNTANYGGAICWLLGNGNIKNCNFKNNNPNSGNDGGAIYWKGGDGYITNCNFTYNNANSRGGAIYGLSSGNGNIVNCNFQGNTANYGGAICWFSADNLNTINCNFKENTANYGGAIYWFMGSGNMQNCYLENNTDEYGADIFNRGTLTISGGNGCLIYNTGKLTNHLKAIIQENKTVGVVNYQNVELVAKIRTGNYTVIGPTFTFLIGTEEGYATLKGDHYTKHYIMKGEVGDEILINGKYDYTGSISYMTSTMLIKNVASITGDDITTSYNKKIEVNLNGVSNGNKIPNGTVIVKIKETKDYFTGEMSDGKATIEIPITLDSGIYHLTAVYEENHDYMNDTVDLILNITKINPALIVTIPPAGQGNDIHVIATVTDEEGMPITEGYVSFTVNNQLYVEKVGNDGRVNITVSGLSANSYPIVINYYTSNGNYNTATKNETIVVNSIRQTSTHTSSKPIYQLNATNVIKYYLNDTHYHIRLTDKYGTPIANKDILVTINCYRWTNLQYNITTNTSGIAKLNINLIPGFYVITATFKNASITTNISVKDVVETQNIVKYYLNATKYTVKVTDNSGHPEVDKKVTVKLYCEKWTQSVTYTIKTNKSGIAVLPINLLPGSYSIKTTFDKTIKYNSIAVLPTLTTSNLVKSINKADNLSARIVDAQGNPVSGKTVKFTIKTKTYSVKTNNDGIANLSINLGIGTWSFLISYDNVQTQATVKVIR